MMVLARFLMCTTQDKQSTRLLFTTRRNYCARVASSHPMQDSRQAMRHAALENCAHARPPDTADVSGTHQIEKISTKRRRVAQGIVPPPDRQRLAGCVRRHAGVVVGPGRPGSVRGHVLSGFRF
jgi:hypothetical protein